MRTPFKTERPGRPHQEAWHLRGWEEEGTNRAGRHLGEMHCRQRGWRHRGPRAGVCLGVLEPQKARGERGAWQQTRPERAREGADHGRPVASVKALALTLGERSLGD